MLAFFLTRNFNFCQSENFVSPFPLSLPIPSVFLLHFYSDVAQYGCHRLLLSIESTNLLALFLILLQFLSLLQIFLLAVSPSVYWYYFKHA